MLARLSWLFLGFFALAGADQKYYKNSNAAYLSHDHLDISAVPQIHCTARIDDNQFAGSTDEIAITFVGDFSVSGPHSFGVFPNAGEEYTRTMQLQREIGALRSVYVENTGADSVLLSSLSCRIDERVYEIDVHPLWIERLDAALESVTGDGNSPEADIALPSSSTAVFPVHSSFLFYDEQGLYKRKTTRK